MNWLQIRLFGPYFSSFSTNSYGYYSQMSQNLFSNTQIFASALIVRQAARTKAKVTKAPGAPRKTVRAKVSRFHFSATFQAGFFKQSNQGDVKLSSEKVGDVDREVVPSREVIIQAGRRRFAHVNFT